MNELLASTNLATAQTPDTAKMVGVKSPTITLRPEASVYQAAVEQAHREGRELGDYLLSLIIKGLIDSDAFEPSEKERLLLREELVEEVVEIAVRIDREEGFRSDIIAEACRRAVSDREWRQRYERFLGGADAFATGVLIKNRINPKFGSRIKAKLGLETVVRPDGKNDTYSVTGSIIQQSTRLKKPGPEEATTAPA